MDLNASWTQALVAALARGGIEHVAISPGNRSAPLALALHAHPGISVSVHVDERVGAFFALGRARAARRPVATLTTSGTAVANQLPAVIEAFYANVPLVVLSADRPPRLRGTGANQTIEQAHLLATHTVWSFELPLPEHSQGALAAARAAVARAVGRAVGPPAGPVHLNIPLDEPLVPEQAGPAPVVSHASSATPGSLGAARWLDLDAVPQIAKRLVSGRGLIVAGPRVQGDAFAAALVRLAARLGAPVLADPLSGVRYARHVEALVVGTQDAFLAVPEVARSLRPDWVLQFGGTPTSKHVIAFLAAQAPGTRILVDETERHPDAAGGGGWSLAADAPRAALQLERAVARADAAAGDGRNESGWREHFVRLDAAVQSLLGETGAWEGTIPARAIAALDEGDVLFIGSSLPVRDLDRFAPRGPAGVRVVANRGASGIDGCVASAAGAASTHTGRSIAVIGDLALQHDLGGLAAMRRHAAEMALVVVNNGGGAIFQGLPVARMEPPFTELFLAPHGLDLAAAARAHGIAHEVFDEGDDLAGRLRAGAAGLLEVVVDRAASWRRREAFRGRLAAVLGPLADPARHTGRLV